MEMNNRFKSNGLKLWQPQNNDNCFNSYNNDTFMNIDLDHYEHHHYRTYHKYSFEIVERDELGQWKRKSHPCCHEIIQSFTTFRIKQNHIDHQNNGFELIPWQSLKSHKCTTTASNFDWKLDNDPNKDTFEIVTKGELGQWKRISHPCCQEIQELLLCKPLMQIITSLDQLDSHSNDDDDDDMTLLVFDEISINSDVTLFEDDIPPSPIIVYCPTTLEHYACQWKKHGDKSSRLSQQKLQHHQIVHKYYSESLVLDLCLDGIVKLFNEKTGSVELEKIDLTAYLPSDLIDAIQFNNDGEVDEVTTTKPPLLPLSSLKLNQDTPTMNYNSFLGSSVIIESKDFDYTSFELSRESKIDYRDDNDTITLYEQDSSVSSCLHVARVAPMELGLTNINGTVPNNIVNDYKQSLLVW